MTAEIKDYIDCLDDNLKKEVKMIFHALTADRNKAKKEGVKHYDASRTGLETCFCINFCQPISPTFAKHFNS